LALLAALSLGAVYAAPTSITGLSKYGLDNGLELFVLENHAVPLVRIQITFRAGAIGQTESTAGLFHFYEHMLFKGNAKYRSEQEFSAAMADLGVAEWNGGTAEEYVTYYFTVPSDKVEQGLEFWSYAVRSPLFDPSEAENEKKVVIDEIQGAFSDPANIYASAMDYRLFPRYPWRRDPAGTVRNIRSATVQTLRDIQKKYYLPNNAAVFVGGDVSPEAAKALTDKWFGDWQRGADPWKTMPPAQALPSVKRPTWLIYSDPSLPEGIGLIEMSYRGPDVAGDPKAITTDPKATYAADVWGTLLANPDGKFKTELMKSVPGLYDKNYINASYSTQRDGGRITFSTAFLVDPKKPAWERAQLHFKEQVRGVQVESMRNNPARYFPKEDFEAVKAKLEDERTASLETADGFIQSLSFWWAVASGDYFLGYQDAMKQVTTEDIRAFLYKFISKNLEIVSLRLSPADFANESKAALAHGFEEITADNAYWWMKAK
jgi:zinc protease